MRVQGKSIIVTGAGSGIGAGIATRLAAEGARIIVNDIDCAAGTRMARSITEQGGQARFEEADMTRSDQVRALVAATLRAHGRLDVFVNNAGWTHRNRPMLEVSEEEFDRVYAVNVKSIYLSALHGVPAMRANPPLAGGLPAGGSFINIASTAGLRPRPGLTWYNGSKGAVITTSKSMAAELGPENIRVNCINPVFNPDTGLAAEFAGGPVDGARRARFLATIPLGRFSTAMDVANAALYLASDEAAFVSGTCIEVDGARCV
ncbi:3-oxoacyl-[acyl-carrier-protein] reductase FabG [Delftia tsuruhatensis]|uniref:SDR family oxidoreductase n=1 Tax=Delftia tsuruhatensis TaxID=180282 RepID=UPI001E7EECA0|nr:SDR family oxidoreductase [Delftia tsuruhatensis]CAB5723767.1 3-oxoacyl-[acyl-carrier-protein] reductase FabG [Delftia tsuruhatensis]CAC9680323.1 3-oxoacyl-[acyl-carrier-protein] reductase FabG [Delftia tsuruhatensis]